MLGNTSCGNPQTFVADFRSGQAIQSAPASTVLLNVPGTGERFQVILNRIAICTGDFSCIGNGYAPTLTAQFKDLYRKFGQIAKD